MNKKVGLLIFVSCLLLCTACGAQADKKVKETNKIVENKIQDKEELGQNESASSPNPTPEVTAPNEQVIDSQVIPEETVPTQPNEVVPTPEENIANQPQEEAPIKAEEVVPNRSIKCNMVVEGNNCEMYFNFVNDILSNMVLNFEMKDVLQGYTDEEVALIIDDIVQGFNETGIYSNTEASASNATVYLKTQVDMNYFLNYLNISPENVSYVIIKQSLAQDGMDCQ